MGKRRAESGVQVAALITNGELDQAAFIWQQGALNLPDEGIQFLSGGRVTIVVDPGKTQEKRHRRPQLCQKLSLAARKPRVNRRQEPRSDQIRA